ncbi:MAG: redox-regulated ATPase YchF [Rickettsiales bacterium]|nr:redox-regulated ATPase YchF [Rickettsiales bacterium]
MSLKCGIVGLPNVGKSTLFNAITNTANAQAANYPFCTIEPNVGKVEVPDARLERLGKLVNTQKLVYNQLEIVDIAGLVAGASKGEGLGNQFLANIRECDVIINVVRCFDDENIVHVSGSTDPVRDLETIETELQLADIATLEKVIANNEKKAKGRNEEAMLQLEVAKKLKSFIENGRMVIDCELADEKEQKVAKQFCLLTAKKAIYVANVKEDGLGGNIYTEALTNFLAERNTNNDKKPIIICAAIEAEISTFSKEEKLEYLQTINCAESGLDKVVRAGYEALGLITFFTVGPKETRAWQVRRGATAPEAAGEIHTDFQRGFIKAETIAYEDYIKYENEEKIKEAGKLRTEGKDYIVKDGDIFNFKFNV